MLAHGMLMAAGGGGLPARVVFDSAGKVANYSIRSGSPSVSYDAANIGMSVSGPQVMNFIAFDAWGGLSRGVAFDALVKFVSDSSARKHMGFFCDSGASGINGYRVVTLDSSGYISKFVGQNETFLTKTVDNQITLSVGSTYKLSASFYSNGNIEYYINDALISRASDSDYLIVRPGFFVYGCGILVKELSARKI